MARPFINLCTEITINGCGGTIFCPPTFLRWPDALSQRSCVRPNPDVKARCHETAAGFQHLQPFGFPEPHPAAAAILGDKVNASRFGGLRHLVDAVDPSVEHVLTVRDWRAPLPTIEGWWHNHPRANLFLWRPWGTDESPAPAPKRRSPCFTTRSSQLREHPASRRAICGRSSGTYSQACAAGDGCVKTEGAVMSPAEMRSGCGCGR